MSKKSQFDSRHRLFLIKTAACFAALLCGSLLLASKAQMQNANRAVVVSNAMRVEYSPTPEPLKSTVRGRVFYEDTGRAVKRTSLMLMGKDGGREFSGLTDNAGVFEIKNVVAGTYYAFVNAPGVVSPLAYADLTKSKNDGFEDAVMNFPPIIVAGGVDTDAQIPVRRGGAISGRVMYADGDPAIGVKVEVLRKVEGKYLSVIPNFSSIFSMMSGASGFQTDDRGVYRFAGLPNGEYVVKVSENVAHAENRSSGYRGFESALFGNSSMLTIFYPDALTTDKATTINVIAGQEMSEINMYLPERSLFSVAGKLVNAKDKTPVKNATISFRKKDDNTVSLFDDFGKRQQSAMSDAQGNWNFKEMPKGTYTLAIEPAAYDYDLDENGYPMNMSNRAVSNKPPKPRLAKRTYEITIDEENLANVVIELGYGATVAGMVTVENNGTMPPNVTITAGQENSEITSTTTLYNYNYGANTAYPGNYQSMPKPDQDFKMEGVAAGKTFLFATVNDDNFYVKSAMLNGTDLLVNPIDLKEGEVLPNVQFVLSKNAGTLRGTVTNDDKQPAKSVWVILVPVEAAKRKNPNFRRGFVTNDAGEFEIKAAPGEYAVIVNSQGLLGKKGEEADRLLDDAVKNAQKVTVKAGGTEKISLVAPK